MRERNVRTMLLLLLLLLFWGGTVGYAGEVRGVSKDTITLGIISDITGPAADTWGPMNEGTKNYLRYANEQGGINGRKIKVIHEDDHYSAPVALAAFKKLVYRDKIFVLMGPGGTSQATALLPRIMKERLPTVYLAPAERLVTPVRRFFFIPGASYEDEVRVIFDYLARDLKKKNPKVGFFCANSEFGKGGLDAARKRAKKYGFKLAREEFAPVGVIDASTQVMGFKRSKVDFVISHHNMTSTLVFLKTAKKFAYNPTTFGTFYSVTEELLKATGSGAKKYYGVHSYNAWYDNSPGMKDLKEIAEQYHPGKGQRNRDYINGWTMAMVMVEGLKRAGKALTPEKVVEGLESLKNFDTRGLCGPISYSPDNHKSSEYCKIYKADVEKKIFLPITEWLSPVD